MAKALEVMIDGQIIGVYVPQKGEPITAVLANIPKTYMRAQCFCLSDSENWFWQLPDIMENQIISFRLIETTEDGVAPRVNMTDDTDPKSLSSGNSSIPTE